jgi:hypothetical protein
VREVKEVYGCGVEWQRFIPEKLNRHWDKKEALPEKISSGGLLLAAATVRL